MKTHRRALLGTFVGALGALHLGASVAAADSASDCSCVTSIAPGKAQIGTLQSVKGNVLVSGARGFGVAKTGASLSVGSQVLVGAKSSAVLAAGQCRLPAPANSTIDISATGQQACLEVSRTFEESIDQSAGLGTGVAGGGTAAAATASTTTMVVVGAGTLGLAAVGLTTAVVNGNKASD